MVKSQIGFFSSRQSKIIFIEIITASLYYIFFIFPSNGDAKKLLFSTSETRNFPYSLIRFLNRDVELLSTFAETLRSTSLFFLEWFSRFFFFFIKQNPKDPNLLVSPLFFNETLFRGFIFPLQTRPRSN